MKNDLVAASDAADRLCTLTALFPDAAQALDAAALHLRRSRETKRAIEKGRSTEYIRVAEGRESIASSALTEALRKLGVTGPQN